MIIAIWAAILIAIASVELYQRHHNDDDNNNSGMAPL